MSDYLDLYDLIEEHYTLVSRKDDPDDPLSESEQRRLDAIVSLQEQLGGSLEEFADNESLMIPEHEFVDYAQSWAEDLGYLGGGDDNPLLAFVDWNAWAEFLKDAYLEVEFDGETYLIRAY